MSIVDVMIPGIAGILLVIVPDIFLGKSISGQTRQRRLVTLRVIGGVLVAVAVVYALIAACR